jgi:hypothetical protein
MTKLRAVAHLGVGGGGWTESKKANLDKSVGVYLLHHEARNSDPDERGG